MYHYFVKQILIQIHIDKILVYLQIYLQLLKTSQSLVGL